MSHKTMGYGSSKQSKTSIIWRALAVSWAIIGYVMEAYQIQESIKISFKMSFVGWDGMEKFP